jgi:para-nitrobenzyl esterase
MTDPATSGPETTGPAASLAFALLLSATGAAAVATPRGGGAWSGDATVELELGRVRGRCAGADGAVIAFLGIPYAAPPVGPLRWQPPQPREPWEGVRECERFGPSCPQPRSVLSEAGGGAGAQDEDCLYLNVWAPAAAIEAGGGAKLPVMAWIHGGGFFLGSASGTAYDGSNLARKGVVVVTLNYRLGPFGFLGHPALSAESPHGSSGNYGLLDQIAALEWVARNVARFGGDPGNVSIFGESAGAFSVGCLLVSPLATGLFHRAIAQSGAAFWITRRLKERGLREESVESTGERVVRTLLGSNGGGSAGSDGKGAETIAAARAKSAEDLLAAANPTLRLIGSEEGNVFGPAVDGWVIPDVPWRLFEEGKVNLVPLLIGTNADEGTVFAMQAPLPAREPFEAGLRALGGAAAEKLLAYYSESRFGDRSRALAEMLGDSIFVAPTRAQVRAHSRAGARCFLYQFTRVPAAGAARTAGGGARSPLGAYHSAEVGYVFGRLDLGPLARPTDVDRRLSATMMEYWLQFARAGDPNRDALPAWPEYVEEEDAHLELGDEVKPGSGLKAEACDLWDEAARSAIAAVAR